MWFLFPVVFPVLALFLWIFWAVTGTEQTRSMLQVQVQALSWGQAGGPGHPCRHQSGTTRFIWGKSLSLHSGSFMPRGDIRHSPDSELTALSPAMSALSQIYLSLPRDNDVLRICMECGSQNLLLHFISWLYRPFPITGQTHRSRSTRENLPVLFPILNQVSGIFASRLLLNNSV